MSDAERVAEINNRGELRRRAMDDARDSLNAWAKKTLAKLERSFPGARLDRDLATLLEQTGQRMLSEFEQAKRRQDRENARLAVVNEKAP